MKVLKTLDIRTVALNPNSNVVYITGFLMFCSALIDLCRGVALSNNSASSSVHTNESYLFLGESIRPQFSVKAKLHCPQTGFCALQKQGGKK